MSINKTLVLIPHFNNPIDLEDSIYSMSNQKVDILIVDDGSVNKFSESHIKNITNNKGKTFFLYLTINKGIEKALNTGLEFALQKDYEYLARLDVGDLCCNDRLFKQEKYLDENDDISIIGSYVEFFDDNRTYIVKPPTSHSLIHKKMYLNSMFIHPSVMFRVNCLYTTGLYPYNYPAAEDLALFFTFIKHFKGANIPEILTKCKISVSGISESKRNRQVITRIKLILENFYFGYYPLYGLLRNFILLITPYKITKFLKFHFKKN